MSLAETIQRLIAVFLAVMPLNATAVHHYEETVDGVTWSYCLEDGGAIIESGEEFTPAIEGIIPSNLIIPTTLGGCPVTRIGDYAFFDIRFETVVIPDTVTVIGKSSFENNFYLKTLDIPSSVTSIQDQAFEDVRMLEALVLPEGLKEIGSQTFSACGFTNVYLSSTVTNIGPGAFELNWYLSDISVSEKNPSFLGGDGLLTSKDGHTILWASMKKSGDYLIPPETTHIAAHSFEYCTKLTSVTFPNSLQTIGAFAFAGCQLESVHIPASVTNIGGGAFASYDDSLASTSLNCITVDSENPIYFSDKGSLFTKDQKSLICVPGKTSGVYAVPEGVEFIEAGAFEGCLDLTAITLPSTVSRIGAYAFSGCISLQTMSIPEGVTDIEDCTFDWCESLHHLDLPAGITNIGEGAISCCPNLKSIALPATLKTIGMEAFADCPWVSFVLPDGVDRIPAETFIYCTDLVSISIPSSVTSIGRDAFSGCDSLKTLTLPASITKIGWGAFSYSGLETLYVPESWRNTDILAKAGVPDGCEIVYDNTPGPPPLSSYAQWLSKWGKTPDTMPEGDDEDGDGATNGEEFVADTNPLKSNEVFKTRMYWDDNHMVMAPSFVSTGRIYGVWVYTNLATPGVWQSIGYGREGLQWSPPATGITAQFGGLTVAVPE